MKKWDVVIHTVDGKAYRVEGVEAESMDAVILSACKTISESELSIEINEGHRVVIQRNWIVSYELIEGEQ